MWEVAVLLLPAPRRTTAAASSAATRWLLSPSVGVGPVDPRLVGTRDDDELPALDLDGWAWTATFMGLYVGIGGVCSFLSISLRRSL